MKNDLVIFGNGEIARMACYYFTKDSPFKVKAFVVDDEFHSDDLQLDGLQVYSLTRALKLFPADKFWFHIALGFRDMNSVRERKYNFFKKEHGYRLASYVCTRSSVWDDLSVGDNCLILENQTIQPTVKIGNNVMIWSGNHLGHGSLIKDHAYISSHVCIGGGCKIGSRCFVGINSTIKDRTNISDDCFVGMASVVTKDLPKGSMVVANRSRVIGPEDKTQSRLLKMFFN